MHQIDEDTSAWLGCPTPLEMYKHQCALLEDELTQAQALLSNARKNIAGLVQMSDALATCKAKAEDALKHKIFNGYSVHHIKLFEKLVCKSTAAENWILLLGCAVSSACSYRIII